MKSVNKNTFALKKLTLASFFCTAFGFLAFDAAAATCTYSITNEWNTGATGAIEIKNTDSSAINGWTVSWQYQKNTLSGLWNASYSGSNPYTASNLSWNGSIQPGQTTSFGFQINKNGGVAEIPIVNGSVCSAVISSSSASSIPASSSSVSSIKSSSSIVSSSSSSLSSILTSSSSLSSVVASSSSLSSSLASSAATTEVCNWYGTRYPLCVTTQVNWGWENQASCIARATCAAQPSPFGIEGAAASSAMSSSLSSALSSSSLSSVSSSVVSSSSVSSTSSSVTNPWGVNIQSLKSLAEFPVGVAVNAGNENNSLLTSSQQQAVVFPHFNQLTAGNIMKMSYLHPSENTYTFANADALVKFAHDHDMKVHAHTLIWHSDYQVPSWMKSYTGDWSEMLKTHVQTIASHFSGQVDSWDVVNEALAETSDSSAVNGYRNSIFFQKLGSAYIDQAFINARAADPIADLFYNDYNTETNDAKTTNLLAMVDGMLARGVPITGVGFQMHVLPDWPSIANIEASFRAVANRGLKVKITELDVRVNNPYNSSLPVYTSLTAQAAATQKERYRQIVAAYLRAVPAAQRAGITVWGVWDADTWLNTSSAREFPLLFDDNFQQKPAMQGFADGLTGN